MSNTKIKCGGHSHAPRSARVKLSHSAEQGSVDNNPAQPRDFALEWLRLVRDRRWSLTQKRQLLVALGSPVAIYEMPYQESLRYVSGPRPKPRKSFDIEAQLQQDVRWLSEPNHHMLTLNDSNYPKLLREIADPPIALFAKGNLALLSEPKVAVVGSRRPTPVGVKVTQQIASDLGRMGLIVTSGMALGVDGLAHQAVLSDGEPTIAVMGCGLDIVYPSRNRTLFEQISQNGLALSEYPLGVPATKYTFPQRNRIVSGLCFGVVIVEAAQRSGTLITARLALEQDRQVMVVPGSSISSQYAGSHRLLQQGAALVLSGLDVVENLAGDLSHELSKQKLAEQRLASSANENSHSNNESGSEEARLLRFVSSESTPVDRIIFESGLTAAEVSAMLLTLEIQGLVVVSDDGGYMNLS